MTLKIPLPADWSCERAGLANTCRKRNVDRKFFWELCRWGRWLKLDRPRHGPGSLVVEKGRRVKNQAWSHQKLRSGGRQVSPDSSSARAGRSPAWRPRLTRTEGFVENGASRIARVELAIELDSLEPSSVLAQRGYLARERPSCPDTSPLAHGCQSAEGKTECHDRRRVRKSFFLTQFERH